MSHSYPKNRIARLVHELAREYNMCLECNSVAEISENSSALDREYRSISAGEYKSPRCRTYDNQLRVQGNFYEEKRRAMQELGYSFAEIVDAMDQPSAEDYLKEVMQNLEKKKKCFERASTPGLRRRRRFFFFFFFFFFF